MRYRVREQKDHNAFKGYYLDPLTEIKHRIEQYVEYPIDIRINGCLAVVFSTDPNTWWIGAQHYIDYYRLPLMGPYQDIETAMMYFLLHGISQ